MRSSYVTLQSEIPNYNTEWLQVSVPTRGTKSFDLIRVGTTAEPIYNFISVNDAKPHRELNNHTNGTWDHQSIPQSIPNQPRLKVPMWKSGTDNRSHMNFIFGRASNLYLYLYNQLFAFYHYVFKFVTT